MYNTTKEYEPCIEIYPMFLNDAAVGPPRDGMIEGETRNVGAGSEFASLPTAGRKILQS